jgi:hypothetical protein
MTFHLHFGKGQGVRALRLCVFLLRNFITHGHGLDFCVKNHYTYHMAKKTYNEKRNSGKAEVVAVTDECAVRVSEKVDELKK